MVNLVLDMIETLKDKFDLNVILKIKLLKDGSYFGQVIIEELNEEVELDNGLTLVSYGDDLEEIYTKLINIYNS